MPFTPAHAAAILPFARGPWVVPALVAGSMAPDLPYFARSLPVSVTAQSWYEPLLNATTSHSVTGAITVALPYALLLTVFWWVARRPLTSLFTAPVEHRATDAGSTSLLPSRLAVRFVWVLASAGLGIATHLAWDTVADSARVIQHLSTAVGLLILLVVLVRHRSLLRPRIGAVAALLLVGGVAALAGALDQRRSDAASTTEHLLRAGAETAGVAVAVALVVVVGGWWLLQLVGPCRISPERRERSHPPHS